MSDRKDPTPLRTLLGGVGSRLGIGGAIATGRLRGAWSEIVGEAMAAHVEPTSLRDGILRVRASSPAWATEAGYLADDIRARVEALLPGLPVREVRVWTGPGEASSSPQRRLPASSARGPREPSTEDPQTAFQRAHRAWRNRTRKSPRNGL